MIKRMLLRALDAVLLHLASTQLELLRLSAQLRETRAQRNLLKKAEHATRDI